jgi:DNA-binding transcriptional ArsR family regulator
MAAGEVSDILVPECLQTLGVSLVTEWDTLAFLHSHSASLGTAADIARLIGYDKTEIGAALHKLEEAGLIHRSRASQGTRIYRAAESLEPGRNSCLLKLMGLAQNRAGRLLLLKHLMRPRQERRRSRVSGLRLA